MSQIGHYTCETWVSHTHLILSERVCVFQAQFYTVHVLTTTKKS